MTKLAIAHVRGVSVYSQSRAHFTEKLNKEGADDYEKRTWPYKMHFTEDGNVFIPPMSFKNCLSEAAKYLSVQIPGKGKSTYTKHIEAGVLCTEKCILPIKYDQVQPHWQLVPADGVRGSGKRVRKAFPVIPEGWEARPEFIIMDDTITRDVFLYHLKQAGSLIGIGTFRPRNNGYWGRFQVLDLQWKEIADNDDII